MTDVNSDAPRRFHGIIPPLVTPLADRDSLDVEGLGRLVEHVIAGGVHGIFILGTTGEGPSLSYRLRCELIGRCCELAAGRVPVLVGITDTSFAESVHLANIAAEAGADAVVLATPYYFPLSQAELIRYVGNIVAELPLPLMLYNMPGLTKVWYDHDTLRTLARHDRIIGIKDSGGDIEYFAGLMNLRQLRPDWSIMIGPEHLVVDALKLGADGGVAGGANIFPALFADCYRAFRAGDGDEVARLLACIQDLQRIYAIGNNTSRFVKATKAGVAIAGLCSDRVAEPFESFTGSDRQHIEDIIRNLAPRLSNNLAESSS